MCRFLLNVREMFFLLGGREAHYVLVCGFLVYLQLIQSGDTLSSYRGGVA